MRLLIVNLHLEIGGVETFLVRLIPLLNQKKVDVTLVLLQNRINPELLREVSPYCTVKYVGDAFPFSKNSIQEFFSGSFDVAFFTISQALMIGSWLLSKAGYSKTRIVLGAYQTEIFCAADEGWRYHRSFVHKLIREKIPPSMIIFGNTAGRDFHANKLAINLSVAPVIRMFVDIEKYKFKNKKLVNRNKIVSIGRINEYKTYNFTMLNVIKRLTDGGLKIRWDVYGDGDQLKKFRENIKELKLENIVFTHGALNYSKLQSVLDDAFLFIGSGTSLIEAAACGVPALTTIEYCKEPNTYGYISEIEGFNMIEPGLDMPVYCIENRIKELISCTYEYYCILQAENYSKAVQYSGKSIVNEYIDVFNRAKQIGSVIYISTFQITLYFASALIGYVVNKLKIFFRLT
jgi:glycosyltransferase involved in cell wall biosynthesis